MSPPKEPLSAEIIIYGSTSASVAAAIQSARLGRSVILVSPSPIIGGIQVNGLGATDIDNQSEFQNSTTLGGLNLELHQRISRHYGRLDRLNEVVKNRLKDPDVWRFESHVAQRVISEWLAEHEDRITIINGHLLAEHEDDEENSSSAAAAAAVTRDGTKITSIRLQDNGGGGTTTVSGKFFLDTTYEGDLLAAGASSSSSPDGSVATITWTHGREPCSTYSESLAGIREATPYRQIDPLLDIDPYTIPGQPSSGLLYGISDEPFGEPGQGDKHLQAYSFRLPLTDDESNIAVRLTDRPGDYDESRYELHRRFFAAGGEGYEPKVRLPGRKTDLIGSEGSLSTDLLGMNDLWPISSPPSNNNNNNPSSRRRRRREIYQEMSSFTKGLLHFFATSPSVPPHIREAWSRFGYPKDEFPDNGNFPYEPYVRDGRRMVSDYIITEDTASRNGKDVARDPVAVAYWPTDTHSVRRVLKDGKVHNEGFIFKDGHKWRPFGVGYRALVPKREQGTNFLTPTCLSSSHVGYGAVRLEHQFYALGQACANACDIALSGGLDVQDVPYDQLRERLLAQGVVLDASAVGVPSFGDE